MNFSLRSVRAKLTLWNVGILALTLIVLESRSACEWNIPALRR